MFAFMKKKFSRRTGTICVHAGADPDPLTGAVSPPLYLTSTYAQWLPGEGKPPSQPYEYSRAGHPTRDRLEEALAILEKGKWAVTFSSGLAATDALLSALLQPGDTVVAIQDLYGGTWRLFQKFYSSLSITFHYAGNTDELLHLLRQLPTVRLIWIETPTNPLLRIVDIHRLAEEVRSSHPDALLVVDNTFATPIFQTPLTLGADLVVHSATKYLGGHSDLLLGAVIGQDSDLEEKLRFTQKARGAIPGVLECYLLLRGIRTLHLRMQRHQENAMKIAKFLTRHPAVEKVFYPGLRDHPDHEIARKQMRGYGGMVSFRLRTRDFLQIQRFLRRFQIFLLAESLGGVESLVSHPLTMTHAEMPPDMRPAELDEAVIRLSVGIEDVQDLIADLEQALEVIPSRNP